MIPHIASAHSIFLAMKKGLAASTTTWKQFKATRSEMTQNATLQ